MDMTDSTSTSSPNNSSSSSNSNNAADGRRGSLGASPGISTPGISKAIPPGHHGIRRAFTSDDGVPQPYRRRPPTSQLGGGVEGSHADAAAAAASRRRSSTFSDYSLNEARRNLRDDILNPGGVGLHNHDASNWSSMPLAFALLPALAGVVFKNGGAIVTDIMLLGLAAVFLHWSVSQPWYVQTRRVLVLSVAETLVQRSCNDGMLWVHRRMQSLTWHA
jgi:hypothetical protein